mmetsp:Transcript_9384/g.24167  ORF Transcript_9384/g.24167 Transcript_9384/m.24167 type:complete len:246 (+) Transcript_9384:1423-2160(+)
MKNRAPRRSGVGVKCGKRGVGVVARLDRLESLPKRCHLGLECGLALGSGSGLLLALLLLGLDFGFKCPHLVGLLLLGFEEVLGTSNTLLRDVNRGRQCNLLEALELELTGGRHLENHEELLEIHLPVVVVIHHSDHLLERGVCLGVPELLHHHLELHQVDEAIPGCVVFLKHGLVFLNLLPGELRKGRVRIEGLSSLHGRCISCTSFTVGGKALPGQLGCELIRHVSCRGEVPSRSGAVREARSP